MELDASLGGERPAQTRFVRAALLIYLGAALVTLAVLGGSILQDHSHEIAQTRDRLRLETELRAHYLAHDLDLLGRELERLGLRSEVNLLDHDLGPERSLLTLAHERSTFFNVGVAILGRGGDVLWSEPRPFLRVGQSFAGEEWFSRMQAGRRVEVVPAAGGGAREAVVWLAAPVMRGGEFAGALVGAIDLFRAAAIGSRETASSGTETILATTGGLVVYPTRPTALAQAPGLAPLLASARGHPVLAHEETGRRKFVIAAAPVAGTDLVLLVASDQKDLFAPATARMQTRLGLAMAVALGPLVVLVAVFVRSLSTFRAAQERNARDERLRHLGVAANVIAHEVKNLLNGMRMGLDMLLRGEAGRNPANERIGAELRKQLERMADFTTELLIFSKGVTPRPVELELAEFVEKVMDLARAQAPEGVELAIDARPGRVRVAADPSLLRIALSNLLANALEALTGAGAPASPRVHVETGTDRDRAYVQVTDNGPGIAEAVRPLIFEPFVSAKPSGSGIGLALSRKIALAHGGDLVLVPTGRGARFLLTLPWEHP